MGRKRHAENGFTLIELMVVVLVLAILIAVAVPAFVGARTRGQNGAAKANLKTSLNAATAYAAASAGTYPDDTQLAADEKSLTFVSGSTVSTGPSSISIATVGGSFTAAVRAASGTCFRVSTVAGGSPVWTSPTGNCQGASGGVVTTLAGSGSSVVANGTGTSASFKDPLGIAVDSDGNVFVADTTAYLIRKITPSGVVTTFAGSGTNASTDGTGTAASFAKPYGMAIDAANNLYVAENSANKIRKITPAGVVTTYAGSGSVGTTDSSSPLSATFNKPEAVAVDSTGNLYVADTNNNRIRKITPAGVVSTLAGSTIGNLDGTGTGARFNKPGGIAVDSVGDIYVADTSNHTIRKITPAGVVTTVAGNGSAGFVDGTGTAARFNYPTSIAIDKADNIRISDMVNSALRTMTPAGIVTTWAGGSAGYVDETGTSAQFNWQWHIAVDASGVVYVADNSNYRVRKVEP